MVDYLRKQDVVVYEGQDDLARNEAFEHLARHIGTHFDLVGPFYEKMKRAVASGHGQRIDIDRWSEHERSAAVQLGTMLHRHGLLKDFYYHRSPKKQLRVIPTKDGSTAQFLTGGWLEIYVSWLLTRRLKSRMSPAKFQVLFNVKGTLPNRREFEADLMANVDGRMLWVECKTGNWQDYSARFKGLVKIFGCDRESAALLLIRPPDASTRSRATDMLDMTLISLEEVDGFMNRFLGISESEAARDRFRERDADDRTAPLPVGMVPPLSEDEVPLEDAEPARKLGHVDLDGNNESAVGSGRRRRRGRRGGRGRRRSAAAAAENEARLNDPLPIEPVDGESAEGGAAAEAAPEPASEDREERGSGRRRRRRRPSPFADGDREAKPAAKDADEDPVAQVEEAIQSATETLADLAAAVDADAAAEGDAEPGDASAEPAEADAEGEGGTKRRRRRRRRRRKSDDEAVAEEAGAQEADATEEGADEPAVAKSEADASDGAAEVETGEAEAADPEPAEEAVAEEAPKPRRRRRRKPKAEAEAMAAEAEQADAAEEVAESTTPVEEAASEEAPPREAADAKAESKVEVDAEAEVETAVQAEPEPEPEPEPEAAESAAEPEPEPEPQPEEDEEDETEALAEEKKSALGVTIAPDLAAMFAKPKDD